MNLNDILQKSKQILGEINLLSESTVSNNALPIDNLILSFCDQAIEEVLLKVPIYCLNLSEIPNDPIKNQDGSGYIELPEDFLPRVIIQMEGWQREVNQIIKEENPIYKQQKNPATRGGIVKPVCVLCKRGKNGILEYYSLPPKVRTHTAKIKLYQKKISIDKNKPTEDLTLDNRLLISISYTICKYINLSIGDPNISNFLEGEITKNILSL
jgi:hypothetical protein|nr:MAG TPA: hypothetical protein [Caudoviricetes sp.]